METEQDEQYQKVDGGHTTTQSAVQLRRAWSEVSLTPALHQNDGEPWNTDRSVKVKLATGHLAEVPPRSSPAQGWSA